MCREQEQEHVLCPIDNNDNGGGVVPYDGCLVLFSYYRHYCFYDLFYYYLTINKHQRMAPLGGLEVTLTLPPSLRSSVRSYTQNTKQKRSLLALLLFD